MHRFRAGLSSRPSLEYSSGYSQGGWILKRMTGVIAASLVFIFTSHTTLAYADEQSQNERGRAANQLLSPEDQRILQRGEIDQGRYIAGGVVGTIAGFGIGHAIQGRYRDGGWVFTVAEGVSMGIYTVGLISMLGDSINNNKSSSSGSGLIVAGAIGYLGFHIWEIVDLWVEPGKINARYHQLRRERGSQSSSTNWHLYPTLVGEANAPGLSLSATF